MTAAGNGSWHTAIERRVQRLEEQVERMTIAVDAHADLLRSLGALASVLAVSADGDDPRGDPGAPGTPQAPPPAAEP